tara:strand:+ start:76 stop:258 length:183 start_codon:yes stop_codon:yes gene_type:complete
VVEEVVVLQTLLDNLVDLVVVDRVKTDQQVVDKVTDKQELAHLPVHLLLREIVVAVDQDH